MKANLQEVGLHNVDLAKRTRRFMASCRLRRMRWLKLWSGKGARAAALAENPTADLRTLETNIRKYAAEVQKSAAAEERKKLDVERAELDDRALLGGKMTIIRDEIERLKTIHFLGECLSDTATNTITKVGSDIADTVITPKLRDRFHQEIVKLVADRVRVEIVRSGGGFGSPEYQVRLFAKPDAKVQDILSEGERTCVALAAFLTELATATHRSALVFDDRVTSRVVRYKNNTNELMCQ